MYNFTFWPFKGGTSFLVLYIPCFREDCMLFARYGLLLSVINHFSLLCFKEGALVLYAQGPDYFLSIFVFSLMFLMAKETGKK